MLPRFDVGENSNNWTSGALWWRVFHRIFWMDFWRIFRIFSGSSGIFSGIFRIWEDFWEIYEEFMNFWRIWDPFDGFSEFSVVLEGFLWIFSGFWRILDPLEGFLVVLEGFLMDIFRILKVVRGFSEVTERFLLDFWFFWWIFRIFSGSRGIFDGYFQDIWGFSEVMEGFLMDFWRILDPLEGFSWFSVVLEGYLVDKFRILEDFWRILEEFWIISRISKARHIGAIDGLCPDECFIASWNWFGPAPSTSRTAFLFLVKSIEELEASQSAYWLIVKQLQVHCCASNLAASIVWAEWVEWSLQYLVSSGSLVAFQPE